MQAETRWYITLIIPNQEMIAAAGLFARRLNPFAPTYVRSVWAGRNRRKQIKCALFPGYIFVKLVLGAEDFNTVRSVPGVRGLLTMNERPAWLSDEAIEAIRLKEQELALPPKKRSAFRKGQMVQMIEGPFAGFCGPIEELSSSGRVKVLLSLLGRHVGVRTTEYELKAMG